MAFTTHSFPPQSQEQQFLEGITELVQSQPYTLDMPGNAPAPAYIEQRFHTSGMRPLHGSGSFRFEHEGYTTLVGQKGTGRGPRIALVFHYDIAPDEAPWQIPDKHSPQVVAKKEILPHIDPTHAALAGDMVIVGKGVADMLGAAEAMLQAAARISDDVPGTCLLIATPDEERGSGHGMIPVLQHLAQDELLPDVLIGAESTFMDVLVRRRAGYAMDVVLSRQKQQLFPHRYRITTYGKNMHPGIFTVEKREAHANLQMARVLEKIGEHQLIHITGGNIVNVIPNHCEAVIATPHPIQNTFPDIDMTIEPVDATDESAEVIIGMPETLEAIAQFCPPVESVSHFGISIGPNLIRNECISISVRIMQGDKDLIQNQLAEDIDSFGVSNFSLEMKYAIKPFFSDRTHPLIQTATEIVHAAGWNPTGNRENHGTSDLNFLYDYPQVIGMEIGPIGANEHGANEWVCVDSLLSLPNIYTQIVERICTHESLL